MDATAVTDELRSPALRYVAQAALADACVPELLLDAAANKARIRVAGVW
jgi:hypothetical protein